MKKILIGIFILSIFVFLYFSSKKSPFINYNLDGKTYKLLTAKNNSERTKGLMNYRNKKELKGADGMMFIFPESDYRQFWNENTYLDLNVYWINNDKVIGKSFLPSILKSKEIVVVESTEKVDRVIELVVSR